MKHLYETIFDQGNVLISWEKMPHRKEYHAVLEKIATRKVEDKIVNQSRHREYRMEDRYNMDEFMSLVSEYNTRITSWSYNRKNGCYIFRKIGLDMYGNDEIYAIDFSRNLQTWLTWSGEVVSIYMQPNNNYPNSAEFDIYKIDPELLDMINDILLYT